VVAGAASSRRWVGTSREVSGSSSTSGSSGPRSSASTAGRSACPPDSCSSDRQRHRSHGEAGGGADERVPGDLHVVDAGPARVHQGLRVPPPARLVVEVPHRQLVRVQLQQGLAQPGR